jgi:hypothetical protein
MMFAMNHEYIPYTIYIRIIFHFTTELEPYFFIGTGWAVAFGTSDPIFTLESSGRKELISEPSFLYLPRTK